MIELFPSRTVALEVGEFAIHWYGVLYVVAFWFAWWVLPRLAKRHGEDSSKDFWALIVAYGAVGVVAGGRLGYAIFYEPSFFLQHPAELFQIWHGGMSSHGGFIGVSVGVWMALGHSFRSMFGIADVISIPAAFGIALGRIGNFINQELYGTSTHVPWGIAVPDDTLRHHPVQVYDACGMMLCAFVCAKLLEKKRPRGYVFAVFLLWYGVQRFLLEYIRFQQWPLMWGLSRGQILTVPLLFGGVLLLWYANKRSIRSSIPGA